VSLLPDARQGSSPADVVEAERSAAARLSIAGVCIDSHGRRLLEGTLTARSSMGRETSIAVNDGAFRGLLDPSVGPTEVVEVTVTDDRALCVVWSGGVRVAEDLLIPVFSPEDVMLVGTIAWSGRRPHGWHAMLFPLGVGRALSVPTSMEPIRDNQATVQHSLIDVAFRSRSDPLALLLVDEDFRPRARLTFDTVTDFTRSLASGITVEGTWVTIPMGTAVCGTSLLSEVHCVPLEMELRRPVALSVGSSSATGLLAKERYFVVASCRDTTSRKVGRIDLREHPAETTTHVDWFGELPGTCSLSRTVVDAAGQPVMNAQVEVKAMGEPWEGLVHQWLRTDQDGRFTVAELPPGSYRIRVRQAYRRAETEEEVVLPTEPRTLILGPARDIHLSLHFAKGIALDAFSSLELWEADDRSVVYRTITDRMSSASLHLRGVRRRPGLRIAARVQTAAVVLVGTARVHPAAEAPDGRVPLVLALAEPVRGMVRDEDDRPVPGIRVLAVTAGDPPDWDSSPPWQRGLSDDQGEFVLHVREGDSHVVTLIASGASGAVPFATHREGSRIVCRLRRR
jgi:protocatechuate 3,4-dioxygenase beta subunit